MNRKGLSMVAATVLLVAAGAGTANAIPYGYAESSFRNFNISFTGTATLSNGTVSVSTSQNYPGTVNTGFTDTQTFGAGGNGGVGVASWAAGGPNATFTAANPGPVGATNTFPFIGSTSLLGGFGAQAAASVGANNVFGGGPGDASYVMVENGGLMSGGPLTATGSQTETVFAVTSGAGGGVATFAFEAMAAVRAFVTRFGETASAATTNTITQFLCVGPGGSNDCSVTTRVGPVFQPSELNFSVTVGPTISDSIDGTTGGVYLPFSTGFILDPNRTYIFGLSSVSTESTSTIPEPVSLGLLGAGLVGLGVVRRRRQKA